MVYGVVLDQLQSASGKNDLVRRSQPGKGMVFQQGVLPESELLDYPP
jgi:hypothetical protein